MKIEEINSLPTELYYNPELVTGDITMTQSVLDAVTRQYSELFVGVPPEEGVMKALTKAHEDKFIVFKDGKAELA